MKVSELIKSLEEIKAKVGDLEIAVGTEDGYKAIDEVSAETLRLWFDKDCGSYYKAKDEDEKDYVILWS